MSVPNHADVIVVNRRPGPALRPGDLVTERRALRAPGPAVTTIAPAEIADPADYRELLVTWFAIR